MITPKYPSESNSAALLIFILIVEEEGGHYGIIKLQQ